MSRPALPYEGACRCGQVRFRVSAPPMLTMACHCTGCQRMTAGPYSLSLAVPSEGFRVTQGKPVLGGLHGETHHFHCGHCMSWMFTRPPGFTWLVNVRAPMLDDTTGYEPFIETYTSEGLPWARTPARHSYETFPPMESFEDLLKEYAELTSA